MPIVNVKVIEGVFSQDQKQEISSSERRGYEALVGNTLGIITGG